MGKYDSEKEALVAAARGLVEAGCLMATGGNLSTRLPGEGLFAVTPSNRDYLAMRPEDVCVLDFSLRRLEGDYAPSVESGLHAAIYAARPDVGAVVHTHQPMASAVSLVRSELPALFDEQARFLGRSVRTIPYAPSGTGFLAGRVARAVRGGDNAFLLANHGALCLGPDLARAAGNAEVLEKCATAFLLAACTGAKVRRIPLAVREIAVAKLRAERAKAAKAAEGGEA